ncbi:DUF3331 domain-containing protein [Burkholderia sp. WSM2232]|uniref:DUF3331 domain-containing protein n=1 Tax=Burkholderia sp. WSM2232 TaxID=944436 RepID=UPI0009FDA3D7
MPHPFAEKLAPTGGFGPGRKSRLSPRLRANARAQAYVKNPERLVSNMERLTTRTLSVSWSDPCSGRYADQLWRLGVARDDGLCISSGLHVRRGDSVFLPPTSVRSHPANFVRMILESQAPCYSSSAS